ncbi:MAG: RNA methyltransferase [Moraxellaceae bacterium]|nr:RNA methyltransferase [Pseudobdellovibrionaceae bacterium]
MFPLKNPIEYQSGLFADVRDIEKHIWPLLTKDRQGKIENVAARRCFDISVVLEGIYDRGNISAVMRTAEGLGFSNFHIIETFEKFKNANRVTQGADKWVEVKKWKNTRDAVKYFKDNKIRICVTSLEASKPLHEIDFTTPLALVLGNEKSGVSQEILDAADERVIIPMPGFVQSFNISVAGALCMYQIYQSRLRDLGKCEDVTSDQIRILKAEYALRTMDSSEAILNKLVQT